MKLLIALLFVLPLSVQAKHHQGKGKSAHEKTWHHRFHHNNQHYLTVGTAFTLSSKKVEEGDSSTSYTIKLGKGVIFKKKYDIAFVLDYEKDGDNKFYGLAINTKYLFKGALSNLGKLYGTFVPYVGLGVGVDKKTVAETITSKLVSVVAGSRFPVSLNMMLGLEYAYSKIKTSKDVETKSSGLTMNWNYFF